MSREGEVGFSWLAGALWALVGASVSVGSVFLFEGGMVPAFLGASLGVWLLWNLGLSRETWMVLPGGAGWPLALIWSYRDLACPVGELALCPDVSFSWIPWTVLASVLLGAAVLPFLRRPSFVP